MPLISVTLAVFQLSISWLKVLRTGTVTRIVTLVFNYRYLVERRCH